MEVKRSGGRTNNQVRAVTSELGLLNKPDGSAKYTAGTPKSQFNFDSKIVCVCG
jgi:ribonuclease PH